MWKAPVSGMESQTKEKESMGLERWLRGKEYTAERLSWVPCLDAGAFPDRHRAPVEDAGLNCPDLISLSLCQRLLCLSPLASLSSLEVSGDSL